jgi:hypothetical protein
VVIDLKFLVWFSGFLVGVSLLIYDELLTLAQYCPGCGYSVPGLGVLNLYQASYLPFVLTLLGFLILAFHKAPAAVR